MGAEMTRPAKPADQANTNFAAETDNPRLARATLAANVVKANQLKDSIGAMGFADPGPGLVAVPATAGDTTTQPTMKVGINATDDVVIDLGDDTPSS